MPCDRKAIAARIKPADQGCCAALRGPIAPCFE